MNENIRQYRERQGLTQQEVAAALHVEQSSVSMWETGKATPRADMLPRIAKLLGCSVGDLFGEGKEDAT